MPPKYLRVVFSPGVNPDKWFGRFDDRIKGWRAAGAQADDPLRWIDSGKADVAIVRMGRDGVDKNTHHEVRLYTETKGVAAPKEHPIKVMDAIDLAELGDETVMYCTPEDGLDNIASLREGLEVVAANVGIVLAPRPLLRNINQSGVVHRELIGDTSTIGETRIALVWRISRDDDIVQDFVGICRGRKAGSSRQSRR